MESIIAQDKLKEIIKPILRKYNAEKALLFGSYARGDATEKSDIDLVIFGGKRFNPTDIFAVAEELYIKTLKPVDVYEISEINKDSSIYHSIMKEGVGIE
ncbi:MAG: nucleotidyltransferase family protein [Eubacteriales bacterium]